MLGLPIDLGFSFENLDFIVLEVSRCEKDELPEWAISISVFIRLRRSEVICILPIDVACPRLR